MGTKVCKNCGQAKDTDAFYMHRTNRDGLDGKCKQCARSYTANWQKENKEKHSKHKRTYRENNEEAIRKRDAVYRKAKFKKNISYRVEVNLRRRVARALHGAGPKSDRTKELLGCSIETFLKHLQGQFRDGMDWSNYGVNGWHMDHIVPCSHFDLSDPEQQKTCFHFTNLQPLWAKENLLKSNKYG